MRFSGLEYDSFDWNGSLYAPSHPIMAAAGRFLPVSLDTIQQYLRLRKEFHFRHGVRDRYNSGYRLPRKGLHGMGVRGDSMRDRAIYDGQKILIQCHDFESVREGATVVIERRGEAENSGSWILKQIHIERPRIAIVNDLGDELDSDDPIVVVRSANSTFNASELDPRCQYRIRGIVLRSLWPEDYELIDICDLPGRKGMARSSESISQGGVIEPLAVD